MRSHLPSTAWVLKLYSNYYSLLIRLRGGEVSQWDRRGMGGVGWKVWLTRMCFLLWFFIIVRCTGISSSGEITANCVCVCLLYPVVGCIYLPCVGVCAGWCAFVCTRGALIPASLSNYLNCAYRSYCTAHFPLVNYTLPSCLPAALAVEISTLGNFVLHNNCCTWGMFLSKKVWTERKTAF